MLVSTEIEALLYLLEDPEPNVYQQIRHKIVSFGPEILPEVYNLWDETNIQLVQERAEDIIHQINFKNLIEKIKFWAEFEKEDLLYGLYLVSTFQYPKLDFDEFQFSFYNLKQDATVSIIGEQSPSKIIQKINAVIFKDYGFRLTNKERMSIENFYINELFIQKKTEVVTMNMLFALLYSQLNLPIYLLKSPSGKCLFGFFKGYIDKNNKDLKLLTYDELKKYIYLFIDVSRSGSIIDVKSVEKRFLNKGKNSNVEFYLYPLNNVEIIMTLLDGMIQYYRSKNNKQYYLRELRKLYLILKDAS